MDNETVKKLGDQLDLQTELLESCIERQRKTTWYVKITIVMLGIIILLLIF